MKLGLRLLLVALVGLSSSACSSFNARWKAADGTGAATRWDGKWLSEKHGSPGGGAAQGRLRAVLEPASDDRLTAHFRANWMIFTSDYTMTLEPTVSGPRRQKAREFRGNHGLARIFGGTYRYTAQLSDDRLTARYTSSYDEGTFNLRRIPPTKVSPVAHARD